jgi:hypothetical protein
VQLNQLQSLIARQIISIWPETPDFGSGAKR